LNEKTQSQGSFEPIYNGNFTKYLLQASKKASKVVQKAQIVSQVGHFSEFLPLGTGALKSVLPSLPYPVRPQASPHSVTRHETEQSIQIMSADAAAAAPAPAAAAPKKAAKPKAAKPKAPVAHPPFKAMVKAAIKALKERNGSSRQAILKYIVANYKVGDAAKAQVRVRLCLKKMVAAKTLVHGGAAGKKGAGCFKLAAKAEKEVKKVKKPKAKKAKKPKAAKKAAKPKAAKKPAAKKAAKPKAAKPKKAPAAKKPAAAKKAAKPKAAKKPAASKPKAAKPKAAKVKAAKKA